MNTDLIKEYVKVLILERVGDIESLKLSKEVFDDIVSFLKDMQGKTQSEFDQHFDKENGRYTSLKLSDISRHPELKDVTLVIKDRETFGIRKGLKALSTRDMKRIHRKGGGYRRKYWISIFIDIDRKQNWSAYNKSFRETIYDKFVLGDNWEHFAHEFTHVLDFQRQQDEYLLSRTEKVKQRKAEREKDEDAYLNAYVNDPSESNAYTRQALSRVLQAIQSAESKEEILRILGGSQREFVDKFMDKYLIKIAKKRFSEDNRLRTVKRAMNFYDQVMENYL